MTKFEHDLRRRCEEAIMRCEQTLGTAGVCAGCDEGVFDRWELVTVLTQARHVLASLDDQQGELRQIIDAGLPVPDRWLF
jgi:hypothetical protein